MRYYKVIQDNSIVGIGTTDSLRALQPKHNILVTCLENDAQYIQVGDTYYHDTWMRLPGKIDVDIISAQVKEITEEEYNTLLKAFEDNAEETIEDVTEDEYIDYTEPLFDVPEPDDTTTIEYVRASKISAMSAACHNIIVSGFDVTLSDGKEHHFDLTTNDQLNLISLKDFIENGATAIPYHASGEPCKFYSPADINLIINAGADLKTYHTTYFNALKQYVLALDNVEDIQAVTYGTEIPSEYKTEVLIALEQGANKQ